MNRMRGEFKEDGSTRLHCRIRSYHLLRWEQSRILGVAGLLTGKLTVRSAYFVNGDNCPMQQLRRQVRTHRGKVLGTAHRSRQQTAFAKHQSWPMVKPVLLAALVCAAPVCLSSAQDAKVSVDMMGIGGMSCAHWQSTQALRLEGTIWIYGFWTGLNYVAAASGQTETKVDTAAVMVEVKKICAQRPSQGWSSAVWTAYLDLNKR